MIHKFSVAPMMDRTDRHCRYFHRKLTQRSLLYTEMLHCNAIVRGDKNNLLKYSPKEQPLAIQIGGSDPILLSEASEISEEFGFSEINLNIGCPSDKVQKGKFGAVLMKEPELVARCIKAMKNSTSLPVTVKCRIGVDEMEENRHLDEFIEVVHQSGCETFIVHARKAWLQGLSPKDNREIPPLNYKRVYKLKEKFPQLNIVINGGITSIDDSLEHLKYVDGVMIGRKAYDDPFILTEVDNRIYDEEKTFVSLDKILVSLLPYIKSEIGNGTKITHITKHLMGLFKGLNGAKDMRKHLVSIDNDLDPLNNFEFFLSKYVA